MKQLAKEIISRIMPSATIASCFGIGFLPEWQRQWSSVLGTICCIIFIWINASEINKSIFDISQIDQLVDISSTLTFLGILFFIIGLIAKYLYSIRHSYEEEVSIIECFSGIFVMSGISLIAIFTIRNSGIKITNYLCDNFILCNNFFKHLFYSILPIALPFTIYTIIDIYKIWPSNKLYAHPSGPTTRTFDVVFSVIYTSFFIYMAAFIFFGLNVMDAINFYKLNYSLTVIKLINFSDYVVEIFISDKVYFVLKEIGIIGIMNYFGILKSNNNV